MHGACLELVDIWLKRILDTETIDDVFAWPQTGQVSL